jgi:hypothetical protein
LLTDGPLAPAFELAVQAGGDVVFDAARGFVPVVDADGKLGDRVFVASSATTEAVGRALVERLHSGAP